MAIAPNITKNNWFFIGAITFFLWGTINTWFGITRYGIEQGMYMWFCNLALFAIAYGLWKKNASWLISWLSFALITQTFWIIDNIWRIAAGRNLFGVIEFMYQPGYPLDEFLISHYHYFIIPTIIIVLLFIKQKKYNTTKIAVTCSMLIFGFSYFFFPQEQNLNCIQEPCLPVLENFRGQLYSLLFPLIVISLSIITAHFIESLHKRINLTKKQKKIATCFFCIIILLSIGLTVADTLYKKTLPTLNCLSPFEKFGMRLSCKYTTEFKNEQIWFVYIIDNKLSELKVCTTKIVLNGKEQIMHKDLFIEPHKKYNLAFIIPYPKENTLARLSAIC